MLNPARLSWKAELVNDDDDGTKLKHPLKLLLYTGAFLIGDGFQHGVDALNQALGCKPQAGELLGRIQEDWAQGRRVTRPCNLSMSPSSRRQRCQSGVWYHAAELFH